jgi:RHS repeat-associated protein
MSLVLSIGRIAAAALVFVAAGANAQGQFKWESYEKRIDSAKTVSALGSELFGDSVELQTGALSFTVTDVDLPGNNALPVRFTRSYRVDNSNGVALSRMLADWDVEVPRLSGRFATEWLAGTSTNRCSSTTPPAVPTNVAHLFDYSDFWQGIRLDIPGVASGELLVPAATLTKPSDGNTYRWTLGDGQTQLSCLNNLGGLQTGATGEGFLAVTPDGVKYRFNWMAQRPITGLQERVYDSAGAPSVVYQLPLKENFLYATEVEDRYGNKVTYTYTNAWNAPARLTQIASTDGRQIDITYGTNGKINAVKAGSTTTPSARTWNYAYGTDNAYVPKPSLNLVTLPDGNTWQIQFAALSHSPIVYRDNLPATEPTGRSCTTPAPYQNGYFPLVQPAPTSLSGTVTHPSGATATFALGLQEHHRSNVTVHCANVTTFPAGGTPGNQNTPEDDNPYFPTAWYAWTLTSKTVSGPGIFTPFPTWNYAYVSDLSYVYRSGSTGSYPVCTLGASCYQPTCTSDACAGTARTWVSLPDGSMETYTFGNSWLYNEGKLLKVERQGSGGATETVAHTYDLSKADQAYLARLGTSLRNNTDGFPSEYHRPELKTTTTVSGATFTKEVIDGPDGDALRDFDTSARPLRATRSSTLGHSITEVTAYHDNNVKWVRGQVQSVTCAAAAPTTCAGKVPSSATFHPTFAAPLTYSAFGKLQQTLTYNTTGPVANGLRGTVDSVADGKSQVTTLTNWYRGVPRNIGFHNGTSVSAEVGDFGQITSTTDQLGYPTSYSYDPMFRLTGITYPVGDTVAWTPKTFAFTRVNSTEYALGAGHWKHVTTHGNYRSEVYYDALWRPVLTREYDNANVAATSRFTARRFDYTGRETFVSYPVATATSYASPTLGVRTTYDALGRVTTVQQDSELASSVLTTTTTWLPGFQRQVTSPRGTVTTTEFQAFDTPDTSSPSRIAAPETAVTTITRDAFGKPTRIVRSGTYASAAVSATRDYVYDAYELLCKRIDPESGATFYEYDGANNVVWDAPSSTFTGPTCDRASVPAADKTIRGYDTLNRLTSVTYPSGTQSLGYSYHPDGALWTATTGDGVNWTYDYNRRRLPTSEASSLESMTFAHAYNALGQVASTTYPSGFVASYAPNALGQPTTATDFASAASYYPNGALKQVTYGNGIVRDVTQNARGLTSRLRDTYGATVYQDFGYVFDENGNVTGIDDTANLEDRTMSYDGLDRLQTAYAPNTFGLASYLYDPLDNLREADLGARKYFYVYDTTKWRPTAVKNDTAAGATVWSLTHDLRGNLTAKGATGYTFDKANRLTAIPSLSSTYYYDAHGRRAAMIVPAGGIYTLYTQDGKLRGGPDGSKSARLWQVYLGDQLIGTRKEPFDGTAASNTYYHTDALGSPVKETNPSRVATNPTYYSPYGEATNRTVDGPGYTGHRMDGPSGLTYMQQRFYDPMLGRFLSVDPDSVDPISAGNFGRYHYANNNPYRFTDPDGRWGRLAAGFVAGTAEEVLVQYVTTGEVDLGAAALSAAVNMANPMAVVGRVARVVKHASKADDVVDVTRAGRSANKLTPDPNATGAHSTFKRDAEGNITNTATYEPNSHNPSGFQETKRVDVTGKAHTNPDGTVVPTPHVKEAGTKGVHPANPDELPKRR